MAQIGQNMMLVNSSFRNARSFTMIPVSLDSPYTEAMYDPASGILAVISKVMKQSYHMVPKLDDDGNPIRLKVPNKQTGKTVKEERRLVDTFSEFYLNDKADIETFIHMFAVNATEFDYNQYMQVDVNETKTSKIILPGQ
jgi:Na+-transporting NADH:ubiquinone oxidoreductase subunit NqrC